MVAIKEVELEIPMFRKAKLTVTRSFGSIPPDGLLSARRTVPAERMITGPSLTDKTSAALLLERSRSTGWVDFTSAEFVIEPPRRGRSTTFKVAEAPPARLLIVHRTVSTDWV